MEYPQNSMNLSDCFLPERSYANEDQRSQTCYFAVLPMLSAVVCLVLFLLSFTRTEFSKNVHQSISYTMTGSTGHSPFQLADNSVICATYHSPVVSSHRHIGINLIALHNVRGVGCAFQKMATNSLGRILIKTVPSQRKNVRMYSQTFQRAVSRVELYNWQIVVTPNRPPDEYM